ncbi:membrane protein, Lom/All family [Escherichia coli]|nr:membrane protein, Lom/All family [Escherichia coli]
MRKVCAAILSAAICLSVSGAPAWASEHQSTLSAGYLHARTNAPGSDNLNGINVKYRYEFTDALGLITSFSYANAEDEQKTHYSDTRRFRRAFLWSGYGSSKNLRCAERWHRKTSTELHHCAEGQTNQQHGGGEHGGL